MNVFVYGSLKRGYGNHRFMDRAYGKYLFDATLPRAVMFDLGHYPGVKLHGGPAQVVSGELYDVPDNGLDVLDTLEGHPTLYIRQKVRVQDADGAAHDAIVYEYPHPVEHYQLIPSGVWTGHRRTGEV